jgi:hypothetical protein
MLEDSKDIHFPVSAVFNGDSREAGFIPQKKIQNPSHALLHTSSPTDS